MTQMMADTKVITTAVELACRAPSLHNSQPWQWVAGSTSVDLIVDPLRTVTSTDRSGREAIISCGAALDHFRVAMGAAGWETNVEQFPNPNNLDHLASIDFASLDYVSQARRDRCAACDTACEPAVFGDSDGLRQRRWVRRCNGCRNHDRTLSRMAARQIRSVGHRGGRGHADDAWYRSLRSRGCGEVIRTVCRTRRRNVLTGEARSASNHWRGHSGDERQPMLGLMAPP
jgi:hypothetical protein